MYHSCIIWLLSLKLWCQNRSFDVGLHDKGIVIQFLVLTWQALFYEGTDNRDLGTFVNKVEGSMLAVEWVIMAWTLIWKFDYFICVCLRSHTACVGLICQYWVKSLELHLQLNLNHWMVDVLLRQMKKIWAWRMQSCQYLDVSANRTNAGHTPCSASWLIHGMQTAHLNKFPTRWNTSFAVTLSTGTKWQCWHLHTMLKATHLMTTVTITVHSCTMHSGHGSSEP